MTLDVTPALAVGFTGLALSLGGIAVALGRILQRVVVLENAHAQMAPKVEEAVVSNATAVTAFAHISADLVELKADVKMLIKRGV